MKALTICCLGFISCISNTSIADWCDGKKFGVIPMESSERINNGVKEIQKEIKTIRDISNKLNLDISQHIGNLVIDLEKEIAGLTDKTIDLCQKSKTANNAAVQYEQITLRDANEVSAQLRINLATFQANKAAIKFTLDKKIEYQSLNERLIKKANELEVLNKSFTALLDPRNTMKNTDAIDSTLRGGCVSIQQSEQLRIGYSSLTKDQLFALAAKNNKTQGVTDDILNDFKRTCNLSPIIGKEVSKGWFSW